MSNSVLNAPHFNTTQIEKFVEKNYYIKGSAEILCSDRDQNFSVTDNNGKKYIVKTSNSEEDINILNLQLETMEYLNSSVQDGICAEVIESASNEKIVVIADEEHEYFLQVHSFIEGKFWSEFETHTDEHFYQLGNLYGKISKALLNYTNHHSHRYIIWDLRNTLDIEKYLDEIDDSDKRKIAKHFLTQYKNYVVPLIPKLRTSVLQNDGNDNNIILKDIDGKYKVSSIIDFGDMANSFVVNEIAIVLAYAMMNSKYPFLVATKILEGYSKEFELNNDEIEVLFYLIAARLCISVCMSAHQFRLNPENEYLKISEKPAWDLLNKLLQYDPQIIENKFRTALGLGLKNIGADKDYILSQREKHLGKSLSVSYNEPLKIVKGFGQYLFDEEGNKFLDCVNNVCHVGHCHPHVVEAAQKQISILNTNTRYLHDHIIEYAKRLTDKFPDPLNVCFLVNSGSEANELALRLARTFTGQEDMVVLDHAYHGNTGKVVEVSPYKCEGPGGKGRPSYVHKINIPDIYRGAYRDKNAGKKYANEIKPIIDKLKNENKGLAGFLFESVLGVGGQVFLPEGFLQKSFEIVKEAGGVCIADEVQIGFGRVGSHMWGFELQDVVPDIVTLGKPIGNGHPLGAVITTKEIADAFNNGMEYFNTFGGNPVSCSIGNAVLDVIENEKLQQNSLDVGQYFFDELMKIKPKHKIIGDVRGQGLFLGIELVRDHETLEPADTEATAVVNEMKDRHVLLSTDGPYHNVIKIKPPIVFDKENVDIVVGNLDEILSKLGDIQK